jgi:hypothetical protein
VGGQLAWLKYQLNWKNMPDKKFGMVWEKIKRNGKLTGVAFCK